MTRRRLVRRPVPHSGRPTLTSNRVRPPLLLTALTVVSLLLGLGACSTEDEAASTTEGSGSASGRAAEAVTGTVTVFAAASLTDVLTGMGDAFEAAHPDATVDATFGPSGGLVTQITEGAPADVIATAATSNMEDLIDADALAGDPTTFATNALAIAVPPGNPGSVAGLEDFARDDLVIALCGEKVPCGRFARQALDGMGIEPAIDSNEEDVRALLAKIEADEVDAGIVYRTDVAAAGDAVEGVAIPDAQNVTATYPIAVTAEAANPVGARAFIAFVLSDEGQAALAEAEFGPP